MVDFLDERLEDVWLGHLFPLLGHNDLLRLRAVCSQTQELATRYLWTPRKRGSWELHITSSQDFQDVLKKDLPPPSELCVFLHDREQSMFETEHVTEFVETYGKYITHLRITDLTIPFTGANELEFYQGLTNLKSLTIEYVHTGGIVEFERRSGIEGSFLFPPRFRNLKTLQVDVTDDLNLTWRFINGMGENLEMLSAPSVIINDGVFNTLLPIEFIENQGTMKYFDFGKNVSLPRDAMLIFDHLQCLRLFEVCYRKGIKIKNVHCHALLSILFDVDTRQIDSSTVWDHETGEMVYGVNYRRNMFIGDLIMSLKELSDWVFLMEMPFLEELEISSWYRVSFRIWRRHGYPSWPNLKKLKITLGHHRGEMVNNMLRFLWGQDERPNMEELHLRIVNVYVGHRGDPFINPREIAISFVNLKKLTIENCNGSNHFFAALWAGLPMLESVNLSSCVRLGNNAFIGNVRRGERPVFMNLQRLKHLKIMDVGATKINDDLFKVVIRNLNLNSLELSSAGEIHHRITVEGLKTLLTGVFAESIEKIKLRELKLRGVSAEELQELESLFRSSQMI